MVLGVVRWCVQQGGTHTSIASKNSVDLVCRQITSQSLYRGGGERLPFTRTVRHCSSSDPKNREIERLFWSLSPSCRSSLYLLCKDPSYRMREQDQLECQLKKFPQRHGMIDLQTKIGIEEAVNVRLTEELKPLRDQLLKQVLFYTAVADSLEGDDGG